MVIVLSRATCGQYNMALWQLLTLAGLLQVYGVSGLVPNLYCGEKNCYDGE